MAELVLRAIGVVFETLLEGVLHHTGRALLARYDIRSNLFVEVLVGLVFWSVVFYALFVVAVCLMWLIRHAH